MSDPCGECLLQIWDWGNHVLKVVSTFAKLWINILIIRWRKLNRKLIEIERMQIISIHGKFKILCQIFLNLSFWYMRQNWLWLNHWDLTWWNQNSFSSASSCCWVLVCRAQEIEFRHSSAVGSLGFQMGFQMRFQNDLQSQSTRYLLCSGICN